MRALFRLIVQTASVAVLLCLALVVWSMVSAVRPPLGGPERGTSEPARVESSQTSRVSAMKPEAALFKLTGASRCLKAGDHVELIGQVTTEPLEMADGSNRRVKVLTTSEPVCVEQDLLLKGSHEGSMVERFNLSAEDVAVGANQKIAGRLTTGNFTQYYLEPNSIDVDAPAKAAGVNTPGSRASAPSAADGPLASELRDANIFNNLVEQAKSCMFDGARDFQRMGVTDGEQIVQGVLAICSGEFVSRAPQLETARMTTDQARSFALALAYEQARSAGAKKR